MTWRWLRVRLQHLLAGDTRAGILYAHDTTAAPTGPPSPSNRVLTPEGVSRLLGDWARTGKRA